MNERETQYTTMTAYVLSGTGNTSRLAHVMTAAFSARGAETRIIPMTNAQPASEAIDLADSPNSLLVLASPTHGFTAPWLVIKQAWGLPRVKRAHAAVLVTRAGLKFGPIFTPGIASSAGLLLGLILVLRGYALRGVKSVDMPSNWYSLHPIQGETSVRAIVERGEKLAEDYAQRLSAGRRALATWNNLYELCWALVLSWISALYLLLGRFFLAKLFFANENCDGCGLCAKQCPSGGVVMRRSQHGVRRPYWTFSCESCMRCAGICPHKAVEAGWSWAVLLYFITTAPALTWGLNRLAGLSIPENSSTRLLLNLPFLYLALWLSYRLFHILLRNKWVNRLFTLSTATHYWGRHRLRRSPPTHDERP